MTLKRTQWWETCRMLTPRPQAFVSTATHSRTQQPFGCRGHQLICSTARPFRQALKSKSAAASLPKCRHSSTQQQLRVGQWLGTRSRQGCPHRRQEPSEKGGQWPHLNILRY